MFLNKIIITLLAIIFSFNLYAHHPGNKIEAEKPYPRLTLNIYDDDLEGYNLLIDIENFDLNPSLMGTTNKSNSGYLLLYINDIKIGRVYSNWFHIPQRFINLNKNILKVTLNNNQHDLITIDEQPIEFEIEIIKN